MKVLFVEPYERCLYSFRKELLDYLIAEKHSVVLCCEVTNRTIDEYSNRIKIINTPINLKEKNLFTNFKLLKHYKKIIYKEKPDLILSFSIKPNIFCGFYAKKTTMIANITGLGNTFKKKSCLYSLGLYLYKKSFKNVDYVFCQNKGIIEFFKSNKIKAGEYILINGSGVNTSKFLPTPLKDNDYVSFLYPSRAIKEKGFELVLESMPIVLEKNKNIHFNFLNSEEDIRKNKRAVEIFGKYKDYVSLLPRTNNIEEVYSMNDFTLSPSFYKEGISNVLLESLSCGRPIITTNDNYGCKEVLVEGENGFGVKSKDLDSLVNAILKAANLNKEEIKKLGLFGREFVIKNFERKLVIQEYDKIIKTIKK